MKHLLLVILLLWGCAIANAQISSIDVFTFLVDLTNNNAAMRLTKEMGYKSGEWGYGSFFYKNTNIRITVKDGKRVPNLSDPQKDAALVVLFERPGSDYVQAITQVFKSKSVADKLVSDLKNKGYKSTNSTSTTTEKSWSYCHPKSKRKFILKYYINTREYALYYSKQYDYF